MINANPSSPSLAPATLCALFAAVLTACGGGDSASSGLDSTASSLVDSSTLAQTQAAGGNGRGRKDTSPAPAPTPTSAPAPAPAPTTAPAPAPAPAPVTAPAPAPAPSGSSTVTAWVRLALEGDGFSLSGTQQVRFGDGLHWVYATLSGSGACSTSTFGGDPAVGQQKICEVQITAPAVTQVDGKMPVVNNALIPAPSQPYAGPRVSTITPSQLLNAAYVPSPTTVGAFREDCKYSHISNDDPIVYPGQPGMAHLHTFFGNAASGASSTGDSLLSSGGSTCAGGTLNRTAYWLPTLIDIRTGQPLVPIVTSFYYKLGYLGVKAGTVKSFPAGLRMIAGNSANTAPIASADIWRIGLECVSGGGHQTSIPSCAIGDQLNVSVTFPQCWDGVNLDSPDHKSHMAYATGSGCPATHPVPLPEISLNSHYTISEANSGAFLKLSSDNYSGPGGYSMHADWFNGWDPATNGAFVQSCINGNMDCHTYLLGDGRILY